MNPPAFPTLTDVSKEQNWVLDEGMSLRDYFAAKAMQGYCQNGHFSWSKESIETISKQSYVMADALLSERLKGENKQ